MCGVCCVQKCVLDVCGVWCVVCVCGGHGVYECVCVCVCVCVLVCGVCVCGCVCTCTCMWCCVCGGHAVCVCVCGVCVCVHVCVLGNATPDPQDIGVEVMGQVTRRGSTSVKQSQH